MPHEIASHAERMGYMQALRAGLACAILASSIFAPDIVSVQIAELVSLTVGYLLLTIGSEAVRLLFQRRGLAIVTTLLFIDGVYLAWAMYLSGGPLSPLRFLVYVHIIGVTLLASHRTGLKIALWHSLLTFVILYAQIAALLPSDINLADSAGASRIALERLSVFNVTAFWIVALATAAFSSINERELRRRQADLGVLAEMAAELEDETEASAIAKIFLEKASSALGSDEAWYCRQQTPARGFLRASIPREPTRCPSWLPFWGLQIPWCRTLSNDTTHSWLGSSIHKRTHSSSDFSPTPAASSSSPCSQMGSASARSSWSIRARAFASSDGSS